MSLERHRDRQPSPGGPIEEFGFCPKSNGKPLNSFPEGKVSGGVHRTWSYLILKRPLAAVCSQCHACIHLLWSMVCHQAATVLFS